MEGLNSTQQQVNHKRERKNIVPQKETKAGGRVMRVWAKKVQKLFQSHYYCHPLLIAIMRIYAGLSLCLALGSPAPPAHISASALVTPQARPT